MKLLIVPLVVMTLSACASAELSAPPFAYTVTDNPHERRIDINLTAGDSRLCLSSAIWPRNGIVEWAKGEVWLTVEGQRFDIRDFNAGYPPGPPVRVAPRQTLEMHIDYAAFDLPPAFHDLPKEVSFFGGDPRGVVRC